MTAVKQFDAAVAAFTECAAAQLNPTLQAHTLPVNGDAEYDVIIGGRGLQGVLHEEIAAVLAIAERHGGRAFVHHAEKSGEGCLCIVWPRAERTSGPDPAGEHEAQVKAGRKR